MDKSGLNYVRLPGTGRFTTTSPVRLYLGDDHLLLAQRSNFVDHYRRYYLRDIQALIILRTNQRGLGNTFLVVALAVLLLIVLAASPGGWGLLVFLVLVAGVSALLITNMALGPTCRCYLRTAVSLQRLPSLRRTRTAQQFIEMIHPAVDTVQGEMTLAEIRRRAEQQPDLALPVPLAPPRVAPPQRAPSAEPPARPVDGTTMWPPVRGSANPSAAGENE